MIRAGFTLIEVLVTAVLVAMVAVAIARGTGVVRNAIRAATNASLAAGQCLCDAGRLAESRAAEVRAQSPDTGLPAPPVRLTPSTFAPEALTVRRPGRPPPISAGWVVAEHGGVFAARWVVRGPGGTP